MPADAPPFEHVQVVQQLKISCVPSLLHSCGRNTVSLNLSRVKHVQYRAAYLGRWFHSNFRPSSQTQ